MRVGRPEAVDTPGGTARPSPQLNPGFITRHATSLRLRDTVERAKLSKSAGTTIDPGRLVSRFGVGPGSRAGEACECGHPAAAAVVASLPGQRLPGTIRDGSG